MTCRKQLLLLLLLLFTHWTIVHAFSCLNQQSLPSERVASQTNQSFQKITRNSFNSTSSIVTLNFVQAIDAAVRDLVATSQFRDKFFDHLKFQVPTCVKGNLIRYPSENPFQSRSNLKFCYQMENAEPYTSVYEMVAQGILDQVNSHYSMSLKKEIVLVNTTDGFFVSLKRAVDEGICDVVVADVSLVAERLPLVNFMSCAYGATSMAYLTTSSSLGVASVTDLNKSGLKVAAYSGTIFEDYIKQNLPLATKLSVGFDEQFEMATMKTVDAIVADAVDLMVWMNKNTTRCPDCTVKIFGDPSYFGTFTAKVNASSRLRELTNVWLFMVLISVWMVWNLM
ncbi:hypothetical protein C9374_002535 [Naegleria lovaniensis]|uniref:Solute-binding protein family 3/N-terminal domain-containing protein n=1 Tax=Naegleria lovaniensis TaxID=51637 RepID=A0AA88GUQ9_NAELO|nr:uncharacterized protein C9374_002535 [Naegleria lovaniensis]KAG2386089.1 hypothetical protein C9374_002535 [Naegleria lovaniensis]